MTQYARPDSDIAAGSWTPSTGSTLYECIDETSASDTDYIQINNTTGTCQIGLGNVTDPSSSSNHIVRYRARKVLAAPTLTVYLYQGSTQIASSTPSLTTSFADYSFTLSSGEADSITDYTDLRLHFAGNASGGAGRYTMVSYAAFECPDAGTPANVTAVVAEATAEAFAPALSGTAGVTGVIAEAAADGIAPSASGGASVTAVIAEATADAFAPTLSGASGVTAVVAESTAAGIAPSASGTANVVSVIAEATADAFAPGVSTAGDTTVIAVVSEATAEGIAPSISGAAGVTGVIAEATAEGIAPIVTGGASVTGVTAEATSEGIAPAVSGTASITGVIAEATAEILSPTIAGGAGVTSVIAEATAEAFSPSLSGSAAIAGIVAESTADGITPAASGDATISAIAADASAEIPVHSVSIATNALVYAECAEASALFNAPTIVVYSALAVFGIDAKSRTSALDVDNRLDAIDAKSRTNALDVDKREAMYLPSLILFEDNSVMLFESEVRAMWETGDAGDKGKVKSRLDTLEVRRD